MRKSFRGSAGKSSDNSARGDRGGLKAELPTAALDTASCVRGREKPQKEIVLLTWTESKMLLIL